jgi:hypothetical protein
MALADLTLNKMYRCFQYFTHLNNALKSRVMYVLEILFKPNIEYLVSTAKATHPNQDVSE